MLPWNLKHRQVQLVTLYTCLGTFACGGSHHSSEPKRVQSAPSLRAVLGTGGVVFRVKDGRCIRWVAAPSADDPEDGALSTLEPDGFDRGISYTYPAEASSIMLSGESRAPVTEAAHARDAKARGLPAGWKTIGVANLCRDKFPVRREAPGVYMVGKARWYLAKHLCVKRTPKRAASLTSPCKKKNHRKLMQTVKNPASP